MQKAILLFSFLLFTLISQAQIEFGIKAGLNSIDLVTNSIRFEDGGTNFDLKFHESKYGHHFGLYTRIKVLNIYIEPAVIFNSNTVTYSLDEYSEKVVINTLKNETYNGVDVPFLLGIKAGILRIFGGLVGHLHINSSSDLWDINGYGQKFKEANYGYQVGFGLDLWRIRMELSYEGNFNKFGDHITIGGIPYSFGDSASRIIGTVGYAF
jgi:hypothetical protein